MLVLGAVLVAVAVISVSVVVLDLSNTATQLPLQQSHELYPVYQNIREKFGFALNDLVNYNKSSESSSVWIRNIFNLTEESFVTIESQHMRYFDAELSSIEFYSDYIDVTVVLYLHDFHSMITEEVVYKVV